MLIQTENGLRSFYVPVAPHAPESAIKLARDFVNHRNESIKRHNGTMLAGQRMGRWPDWKPVEAISLPAWAYRE